MSFLRNLKPHVRVFELLGESGDGKTTTATVAAAPNAVRFLESGVKNVERMIIYTQGLRDSLVLAVSIPDEILPGSLFTEMFTKSVGQVAREEGKVVVQVVGKGEEALVDFFKDEIKGHKKAEMLFSFLSDEKKDEFFRRLVSIYHNYEFSHKNQNIYQSARINLDDSSVKENSERFFTAILSEVKRTMDLMSEDFKRDYWDILGTVNDELKNLFFRFFNRENLSKDGYYYKEMSLDNPDESFMNAMFEGDNPLAEIAGEMIIYVPMHERIQELFEANPKVSEVFKDISGNFSFGIIDTVSPFDKGLTTGEKDDIIQDLVMRDDVDALLFMSPLDSELEGEKAEFYKDVIKNLKKPLPIFLLNNKLDLFVEQVKRDSFFDDPLSTEMSDENFVSTDKLISEVQRRENTLRLPLAKGDRDMRSLSFYLRRDHTLPKELVEKYNVVHSFQTIFESIALSLRNMGRKLNLKVEDGREAVIDIDEGRLQELVHEHITAGKTDKKVYSPALIDIAKNIGLNPHPSAYLALKRRLKHGEGYTSTLDEGVFYHSNSFSVNFTDTLKHFIDSEFISSLISQTLRISGAGFDSEDGEDIFRELVKYYIEPNELVEKLLYDNAVKKAEKIAFSDKSKFQNFLENSMDYFNISRIDEEAYRKTLLEILNNAAEKALNLNTLNI